MIEPVTLELPFPPSVNSYWRTAIIHGSRRTMISKAGRLYRDKVITQVRYDRKAMLNGTIREPVAVRVTLHRGDRRLYDVDNHFKAIGDALTHAGFWEDDSLIDWLLIERGYVDTKSPGAKVEVSSHVGVSR